MFIRFFLYVLSVLFVVSPAMAETFPHTLPPKVFVLDQANMIDPSDEALIQSYAERLVSEQRVPIFVVTIDSLNRYGAGHMSVEQYARGLFDEWGIGSQHRNYGMLLFVSKLDRRARIELGHDWAGAHDADAQYIMDQIMIARFKEQLFSEGIREAVIGMDAMARGLELPSPYLPSWVIPLMAALAFISLCVGLSFLKDGKKGFGWLFITISIAIILAILHLIWETIESSDGLDGGFGGGGGASGSW